MAVTFNPFTGKLDFTGASAFTGLSDVPSSYSGYQGQAVVVNTAEDGLEFVSSVQAFDGEGFNDTYTDTVDFDAGAF